MANQEGRILLALSDIKDDRIKSLRAAAKLYDIPYRTLAARASGRAARVDKPERLNGHKLTELEPWKKIRLFNGSYLWICVEQRLGPLLYERWLISFLQRVDQPPN